MDTKPSAMSHGHGIVNEKSGPTHNAEEQGSNAEASSSGASIAQTNDVPMKMKLFAVLLVTAIGFGSHWSSGVTGAMKSTLKKVSSTILTAYHQDVLTVYSNCTSTTPNTPFWRRAKTL